MTKRHPGMHPQLAERRARVDVEKLDAFMLTQLKTLAEQCLTLYADTGEEPFAQSAREASTLCEQVRACPPLSDEGVKLRATIPERMRTLSARIKTAAGRCEVYSRCSRSDDIGAWRLQVDSYCLRPVDLRNPNPLRDF
jgi:hypothetical protein